MNLIDIGETNFQDIISLDEFKNTNDINIYITHMHSDHVGGLSTLHHYIKFVATSKRVKLYSPLSVEILELFKLSGNDPADNFEVIHTEPAHDTKISSNASISFTFVPTEHIHNLTSYGILFLILASHEAIYFSGDSTSFPGLIDKWLYDATITEVYQDVTNWKDVPHMHVDVLCERWRYPKIKLFPYHNSDTVLRNGIVPAQFSGHLLRLFEDNFIGIMSNLDRYPDMTRLEIYESKLEELGVISTLRDEMYDISRLRAFKYESPYGPLVLICIAPTESMYGDVVAIIEPHKFTKNKTVIHYAQDSIGPILPTDVIYGIYSAIPGYDSLRIKDFPKDKLYLAYDIDENRIIMSHNFYDYKSKGGK